MLAELIRRVEDDANPDYELDCEIGCAVDDWTGHPTFGMAGNTYTLYRHRGLASQMPDYTASLDEVALLIERKLPHHFWIIDSSSEARLAFRGNTVSNSRAPTPSRALLAAFLRAYQESGHGNHD